ncbi:hypothetical protein I4U23_016993 [Adineta vaga]|nr:hypothetical protein I4U23_016993 [Adineta vaga]
MSFVKRNPSQTAALVEAETNIDLFRQGDLLFWKGEYEKAKQHFQAVSNQPWISPSALARCLNSLGALNGKLKHYKEAINNYCEQLNILLNLNIPDQEENIARCYMSMGMVYWLEQHYDLAIEKYKEALSVLPDSESASNLISDIYKNMGNLYTKKHEFASAQLYFEKALDIDRHHLKEDHPDFGQTYANIGTMYYTKRDYQQALNYFEQARETWRKSLRSSHVYLQSMEKTIYNVQTKLDASNKKTLSSKNDATICKTTTENHSYTEKTENALLAEYFSLIPPAIQQEEIQSDSGLDSDGESISDISVESELIEVEENLEYYTLIWCGKSVNSTEENRRTKVEFRKIINFLKTFETNEECRTYIERSVDEKIVLIISGNLGQDLVPEIHYLEQIVAVYIYCENIKDHIEWSATYGKVKAVVLTTNDLVQRIMEDQKRRNNVREEEVSISIVKPSFASLQTTHQSIKINFLFFLSYIDVLSRMDLDSREAMYNDFVSFCEDYYTNNRPDLGTLNDFQHNYSPSDAVQWYTRDTFIYRILNKALRTEDITVLYKLRFYIVDLHRQLMQLQMTQANLQKSTLHVYRGAQISVKELEAMKTNTLICMNSFLSASHSREVASMFCNSLNENNQSETSVLFEIEACTQLNTSMPFADISHLSAMGAVEQEILFLPGSVFTIDAISQNVESSSWTVKLTLVDREENDLESATRLVKNELEDKETLSIFGNLLHRMGKYKEAERYYKQLLNSLKENDPRISKCYTSLGTIKREKADYSSAYSYYSKALEFNMRFSASDQVLIAKDYRNIGLVMKDKADYDRALENLTKALNLLLSAVGDDNLITASVYHNIGLVYVELYEYESALSNLYKCLQTETRLLSTDHPEIASILNNVGVVHYLMKDYDFALEHYKKALSIQTTSTEKQSDLANTYINIGLVHATGFKNYPEAISKFEMSLQIFQNTLPANHPSIIRTQNIIQKTKQILNNKR